MLGGFDSFTKRERLFSKLSQIELNEIMRRAKLLNVLEKSEVEVSFSSSKKKFSKRYWLLRNISEIQMGRVIVVLLGECLCFGIYGLGSTVVEVYFMSLWDQESSIFQFINGIKVMCTIK